MKFPLSAAQLSYTDDKDLPEMSDDQQAFLLHWLKKSSDINDGIPARADFPPNKFAHIMPFVIIFDILTSPLDFQFRLMGTGVREYTHKDFTGKKLSDLVDKGPSSKRWRQLETVFTTKKPLYESLPYVGPRASVKLATVLLVPMASDNENIDKIFQVTNFVKRNPIKFNPAFNP